MNNLDIQHKQLIEKILKDGENKLDRTGVGTRSIFGHQMRFKMTDGFPLLTLRKIHTKSLIHEILWFLSAYDDKYKKFRNTNIRYLVDNGVTFWTDWPLANYNKYNSPLSQKEFEKRIMEDDDFALQWGDLGPVYGKQWLNFSGVNQIDEVINLLKNDPDSRRIILNAWNPPEIPHMMLPPCHMFFQLYSFDMGEDERFYFFTKDRVTYKKAHKSISSCFPKRRLDMQLYIRSQDVYLGQPFNIAEYALLLHMLAQVTNMVAGNLIYTIGDAHLYTNSIDAAKTICTRTGYDLSKLVLNKKIKNIYDLRFDDIQIEDYKSHNNIYVKVAV